MLPFHAIKNNAYHTYSKSQKFPNNRTPHPCNLLCTAILSTSTLHFSSACLFLFSLLPAIFTHSHELTNHTFIFFNYVSNITMSFFMPTFLKKSKKITHAETCVTCYNLLFMFRSFPFRPLFYKMYSCLFP